MNEFFNFYDGFLIGCLGNKYDNFLYVLGKVILDLEYWYIYVYVMIFIFFDLYYVLRLLL